MSETTVNELPTHVHSADSPRILHKGVYTLYEKQDGTLRIQYRRTDHEEDDFMEIPGAILRLAKAASEGKMSPMQIMKAMRQGEL